MSDKIRIYGQLESGLVNGYVTNKDQVEGLADSLSGLNTSIGNLDQSDVESFTYDDAKGLVITTKGKTEFICDLTELKNQLTVDGMLEDVSIITSDGTITHDGTTYPAGTILIKFLWNTAAGSKVDYLRADQIGKVYTAGTGINIDNTTNAISVSGINDELVHVDSITVGGTPLADVLTAKGVTTINAGNLQEVLISLFSNETWPSDPKRTVPTTATVSMSAPNMSFDKTIAVVGSTVKLTASTNSASGNAKVSYSGFTNGWSKELNKTNTGTGNPSPVKSQYNITRASGEYGLTFTVNEGFGGATIAAASGSNGGAASKQQNLTVAKGNNKVTCTASSPVFKIDISAEPKYYALSTLKNASEDHIVAASNASTISNLQKTGVTNNKSVTGVYPIYSNAKVYSHTAYADGGDGSTAAKTAYGKSDNATAGSISETALTALTNGTTKFYTFLGYGNGGFTIQVPEGWKVTTAQDKNPLNTGYFDSNFTATPTTSTVNKTFGSTTVAYTQYVYSISANNICRLLIEPKTT